MYVHILSGGMSLGVGRACTALPPLTCNCKCSASGGYRVEGDKADVTMYITYTRGKNDKDK